MTGALLLVTLAAIGQTDDKSHLTQVHQEARAFAKAFQDDDAARLADLTFAPWLDKLGSRGRAVQAWRKRTAAYRHQGLRLEAFDVQTPEPIVKAGKDWISVVPIKLQFQGVEGPASLASHLFAISRDAGKTWRFLEGADAAAVKHLDTWLPDLPDGWERPASGKVRHTKDGKRTIATSTFANFKVAQPDGWERGQPVDKNTHLLLERGDDVIHFIADASDLPVQELVRSYETNRNGTPRRFNGQKDMLVAGARARFLRFEDSNDQQILQYYLCLFTHQGMSYRIIGVRQGRDQKGFEADYFAVLERFAFLGDRPSWLKTQHGVPTKTVLLGGLASFELDRPRWTEDTFDLGADYRALDTIDFRYLPLDAWINVSLFEAQGSIEAELQEIAAKYTVRVQKPRQKPLTFATAKGKWSGVEIRGTGQADFRAGGFSQEYAYFAAVKVHDGVAAWVVLETARGRDEDTLADFEELLESFELQAQSQPKAPLAFPMRRFDGDRDADARVAALLKKATRLYPGMKTHEVLGFTPDGKQAMLATNNAYYLEDLATKKRDALPIKGVRPSNIALSSDRRWLAYQVGEEITMYPMSFGFSRKFRANATMLGFGPNNRELLLITSNQKQPLYRDDYGDDYRGGGSVGDRYLVSKLERQPLDNSPKKPLFDWPLIRVTLFALSPDQKQIAVVANRDFPRSQQFGGLLYVCNADGSDLRLVNKDASDYRMIAWATDGKSIDALRRPLRASIGQYEVERIAVESGAVMNLTRCGRLSRAWSGGDDLFIEIRDHQLPLTQEGIYRINPTELAKTAAMAPAVKNPGKALAPRVAERLERVLDNKPLAEYVPTEASLQALAKEFADAIQAETGVVLDQSAESLDRVRSLIDSLQLASGKHRVNILGVGAYYGETLKKAVGAKWHLRAVPFGQWTPVRQPAAGGVVEIVLPFSDTYGWAMFTGRMLGAHDLRTRAAGQEWLLVYPPTDADEVLKKTCGDYLKARKEIDAGNIDAALKLLAAEQKKRPRNAHLARELVALCRAIEKPDLAAQHTKQAVEAGVEASDLMVDYADALAKTTPDRALVYYRKAAHQPFVQASTLIKMGRAYQQAGQAPLAESCWRRAYNTASDADRAEIRRLMGMPPQRSYNDIGKDFK